MKSSGQCVNRLTLWCPDISAGFARLFSTMSGAGNGLSCKEDISNWESGLKLINWSYTYTVLLFHSQFLANEPDLKRTWASRTVMEITGAWCFSWTSLPKWHWTGMESRLLPAGSIICKRAVKTRKVVQNLAIWTTVIVTHYHLNASGVDKMIRRGCAVITKIKLQLRHCPDVCRLTFVKPTGNVDG